MFNIRFVLDQSTNCWKLNCLFWRLWLRWQIGSSSDREVVVRSPAPAVYTSKCPWARHYITNYSQCCSIMCDEFPLLVSSLELSRWKSLHKCSPFTTILIIFHKEVLLSDGKNVNGFALSLAGTLSAVKEIIKLQCRLTCHLAAGMERCTPRCVCTLWEHRWVGLQVQQSTHLTHHTLQSQWMWPKVTQTFSQGGRSSTAWFSCKLLSNFNPQRLITLFHLKHFDEVVHLELCLFGLVESQTECQHKGQLPVDSYTPSQLIPSVWPLALFYPSASQDLCQMKTICRLIFAEKSVSWDGVL